MLIQAMNQALVVELEHITKRFPGVVANQDINLRVVQGEVHAIVGENGAGKSTLMKILYGMQQPDEGVIKVNGEATHLRSPRHAIQSGIGMVHQHFMLADNLTVLENVVLGSEPTKRGQIHFAAARTRIAELASAYGLELDPDSLVANLSVGERQRLEIVKVLYRGARILILDEPTAVLVPQEIAELFASVRRLTAEGVTVLFISHKLDEVLQIADRITVIRAGRSVATVLPGEVDVRRLAELMIGSELPSPATTESTVTSVVELAATDLGLREAGGRWLLAEISFEVHRGEVVGIAGVEGNGQAQLIEVLSGVRKPTTGSVQMRDEDVTRWGARRRREAGLGIIPEDRHRQGLLLPAPLWENVMLGHQTRPPFSRGPWVDRKGARAATRQTIDAFDVRTPGVDVPAIALSGGNQQKLVAGKEILAGPRVLLAAHPTRGIDIGAQAAVWDELKKARAAGMAILLISADLDELIGLSDTLAVLLRGRLVAKLDPQTVTPEILGTYMTGAALGEQTA